MIVPRRTGKGGLLVVIRTPDFSGVVASVNGKDLTFFPSQKQLIKV